MYVRLDYDNLRADQARMGVRAVIELITDRICSVLPAIPEQIEFRLYHGWYEEATPTRQAQKIIPVLQAEFPTRFCPFGATPDASGRLPYVRLLADLAVALLVEPHRHLLYTVRPQQTRFSVYAPSSERFGERRCVRADCCLRGIKKLFKNTACPECDLTVGDLFPGRRQQKLVDTMLTADLLHLSTTSEDPVALVSSDDDMMPPILQALYNGVTVVHVHTRPGRRTPSYYLPSLAMSYIETSL